MAIAMVVVDSQDVREPYTNLEYAIQPFLFPTSNLSFLINFLESNPGYLDLEE